MKVVFCVDDNWRYMRLLQVAVRSLRKVQGADVPCLCVYAGDNARILDALEQERVPVARYQPVLSRDRIPKAFHTCIGCFLKLELSLLPELADDPYALYCDVDVLFHRNIDALLAARPAYMAMARENTAPFFHDYEQLTYTWRGQEYRVPMPFPIWTFSSGVVVFHLERLRKHEYIYNFLEFCAQNMETIGNLDQSMLNYFFGKRIEKLEPEWNRPPYQPDSLEKGRIIHFHGPKPWDVGLPLWDYLRVEHYWDMRDIWLGYLTPEERAEVEQWSEENRQTGDAQRAAKAKAASSPPSDSPSGT